MNGRIILGKNTGLSRAPSTFNSPILGFCFYDPPSLSSGPLKLDWTYYGSTFIVFLLLLFHWYLVFCHPL